MKKTMIFLKVIGIEDGIKQYFYLGPAKRKNRSLKRCIRRLGMKSVRTDMDYLSELEVQSN